MSKGFQLSVFSFRQAWLTLALAAVALLSTRPALADEGGKAPPIRGRSTASTKRPATFPHRIWAACDFEGQTPDYGWFGRHGTNQIPTYPGNRTALTATERPYQNLSAVMAGINPVPGPRMGKENGLYLRYRLTGGRQATFQHFSLTREDNWHIVVDGLTTNRWDEVTLNFTRDAKRNDGSSEPFGDGERMDDFKLFGGLPAEAARYQLFIDDVIFFANDPTLPPEPEPFPNRVILLAAFDTGPKEKYWPGDFELVEIPPAGANWRAARSVRRRDGAGQFISLPITPPRPVGAHTKLRFRYHLLGASALTVQLFDATVQDNRHIRLPQVRSGEWTTVYLDFTRDSRRNDGSTGAGFPAGNLVDDLFFFVEGDGRDTAVLFVDEVVLFDAGTPERSGGGASGGPSPPTNLGAGAKAGNTVEVAGLRLCWCPPGHFRMGSPPGEPERRPGEDQVEVTLTRGFWMSKFEATQGDWKRIMSRLPGEPTAELPEADDLPVGNVNFAEAEAYCATLTALAHQSGELPAAWEFRLPTEAQWEYACRAGTTTATAFGERLSSRQANFKGKPYNGAEAGPSLGRAAKVGSYPANAWGLHDMHGNTFEWCRDWYHRRLPGGVDPDLHDAPDSATKSEHGGNSRVRRGGCWADEGWPCRSAFRLRFEPERRYDHIGFRVVAVRP